MGQTGVVGKLSTVEVLMNIVLTVWLTPKYGVFGAGLASTIAGVVTMLNYLVYNYVKLSKEWRLNIWRDFFAYSYMKYGIKNMGLGVKVFLSNSLYNGLGVVFIGILNSIDASVTGLYNMVVYLESFIWRSALAVGTSLSTYIGYNIGKKAYKNVRVSLKGVSIGTMVVSTLGVVLLYILGEPIMNIMYPMGYDRELLVYLLRVLVLVEGVQCVGFVLESSVYVLGKVNTHVKVMTVATVSIGVILKLYGGVMGLEKVLLVFFSLYVIEGVLAIYLAIKGTQELELKEEV